MTRSPTISVVTISRNDLAGLRRTASSLDMQSELPDEWIVVDGASTDGSVDWLGTKVRDGSPLGCRTRFGSEPDGGIYPAMWVGARRAVGEFVLFLNSGDALDSMTVIAEARHELSSDVDVLYGATRMMTEASGSRLRPARSPERTIWHGNPAVQQSAFIRRSVLRSDMFGHGLTIAGDYFLMASLHIDRVATRCSSLVVARFTLGGLSSRRPVRLAREALRVQIDVLGLPPWKRYVSLIRRTSAMCYYLIWNQTMILLNRLRPCPRS